MGLLHVHRCLSAGAVNRVVASSRGLRAIAVEVGERSGAVQHDLESWNRCKIGREQHAVARQRMFVAVGLVLHSFHGEFVVGVVERRTSLTERD